MFESRVPDKVWGHRPMGGRRYGIPKIGVQLLVAPLRGAHVGHESASAREKRSGDGAAGRGDGRSKTVYVPLPSNLAIFVASGVVAQLGERWLRKSEVAGAEPADSTSFEGAVAQSGERRFCKPKAAGAEPASSTVIHRVIYSVTDGEIHILLTA